MKIEGHLDKMATTLNDVVSYQLPIDEQLIDMNELLGQRLSFTFQHKIHCMCCGKQTKTSFGQGYCYNCFTIIPQTDECVLNPEKCKAHLGIARDMVYATQHCLSEHVVYLSFTSNVKVGVTRLSQVPTRWIDQGAIQAIRLASAPNRHIAGLIEVFLKQHLSDKTSWQQMLQLQQSPSINLNDEKQKAINHLPQGLKQFIHPDDGLTIINYPMLQIPAKIISTSFNKNQTVEGVLTGIKGQYLIFDHSIAFNIRTHRGYLVSMQIDG